MIIGIGIWIFTGHFFGGIDNNAANIITGISQIDQAVSKTVQSCFTPSDDQQQIFKNLYRVPTGNIYKVKGFGIGLYYVKTIVEAHGGHVILKSEVNKGSRFDVYLPFDSNPKMGNEYDQT